MGINELAETRHRFLDVDGIEIFFREAGLKSNPCVLLLHGFPSSSFQYRYLLADLADRFYVVAPDFPAFGLSATPLNYEYTFENLAKTTAKFLAQIDVSVSAVYLHDYGLHVGFRLMTEGIINPRHLIIQGSEIYENCGWKAPMAAIGARVDKSADVVCADLMENLLTASGIRKEFVENLTEDLVARIDPTVVKLAWQHIAKPSVTKAMLDLHLDYPSNIARYERNQEYLRSVQPVVLVLWGQHDQYISVEGAEAYRRDLKSPTIQSFDGGHWLLETNGIDINRTVRQFLTKTDA